MPTLMQVARSGTITEEMVEVARFEGVSPEKVRDRIARGTVIIVRNLKRVEKKRIRVLGVGEGLSTKVNANVGTSRSYVNPQMEVEKAKVAVKYGADTVMDLSTGGDLRAIRRMILDAVDVPVGTVPTYQVYVDYVEKGKAPVEADEDYFIKVVEEHLKDGVDFMTIHAGVTLEIAKKLKVFKRVGGVVSRGGTILIAWMLHNNSENPYYKNWDYILELFAEYDATISIGDALRPGAIEDAHDYFQLAELITVADLVRRAWEKGVQVMVEGPGHVPLDEIWWDVKLQKKVCRGAPYYVLGPLPTDIAAGYDHIASAAGAAIAAAAGADLICYVTPAEHLSLPNVEQVKEGVIAAKIAAHIGDIVKLGERARRKDLEMSKARAALDWEKMLSLVFDKERAIAIRKQFATEDIKSCTMCGDLCVYLILKRFVEEGSKR